ncbi:hypothetical protein, partial [Nitrosomonas sp.]|uniref:hypothetical protein n=1 Tax=Nitrosomonas sp. TaxID=42353 RepID=UPI002617D562
ANRDDGVKGYADRDDGVSPGIASTTTVIASRASGVATQSDGDGDLDCRIGLRPSRNDGVFLGIDSRSVIHHPVRLRRPPLHRRGIGSPRNLLLLTMNWVKGYANRDDKLKTGLKIALIGMMG